MKDFCVVGSGFSGAYVANQLSKKYTVEVFEKAKGLGGRSSYRRGDKNTGFDHGLQYISPKSKVFISFIKKLEKKKIIKKWLGNHLDFNFKPTHSNPKYIGKTGNNIISKHLLKKIKTNCYSTVSKITYKSNYWEITLKDSKKIKFKKIILSCPFIQSKTLAKKYLNRAMLNLKIKMEPNITIMAIYKNNKNLPISSIKFNDKILGWAANENSKKRFLSNYSLWTIQSNFKWAKNNINYYKSRKKNTTSIILNRFQNFTGLSKKEIVKSFIHGWKYSYNLKPTKYKSYWSSKYNLGLCGDWFVGPTVESSWVSANHLLKQIHSK